MGTKAANNLWFDQWCLEYRELAFPTPGCLFRDFHITGGGFLFNFTLSFRRVKASFLLPFSPRGLCDECTLIPVAAVTWHERPGQFFIFSNTSDFWRQQLFSQKASLFDTSRPRSGDLIPKNVDLNKLIYQCASLIAIRVFPGELHLLHRRHAAAMEAPRLGPVLLIKLVLITEQFSWFFIDT